MHFASLLFIGMIAHSRLRQHSATKRSWPAERQEFRLFSESQVLDAIGNRLKREHLHSTRLTDRWVRLGGDRGSSVVLRMSEGSPENPAQLGAF